MTITPRNIPEEIKKKIQQEYELGYEAVRTQRDNKKRTLEKVIHLYSGVEDGVKINLLWKMIKLENAIFLSDDLIVEFISEKGIISDFIMKNANKVCEYDNNEMHFIDIRRRIIFENCVYGLSATVIDGWDVENNQPITDNIHPLAIIPDPKNWTGSRMRFIGFTRRVTIESLENNDAFYLNAVDLEQTSQSQEMNDIQQDEDSSLYKESSHNLFNTKDDGMVDIYDHYTTYKGKKYLTTWINDREQCIRCIEIEGLTSIEKQKPERTRYPIQIHRRNPMMNSFFGISLADEVLQYQDQVSILLNLQLNQAKINALGPNKYIDKSLKVDIVKLEQNPGGNLVEVSNIGGNINNKILYDVPPNPSQFPSQIIGEMENRAELNTGVTSLAFGQSLGGTQTKAEVQTLMQNTNQLLLEEANNYMRGEKDYWEEHYKSYVLYMGARSRKNIALFHEGKTLSRSFAKKDFVAKEKVVVRIQSKNQTRKQNEKEFAKLQSIAGLIMQNIRPGYAMNEFMRKLLDALSVTDLDPKTFIPESVDEMRARMNLELLNNNIRIEPPQHGEDYETYLEIYKQALDTEAKIDAINMYTQALIQEKEMERMQAQQQPPQPEEMGKADATTSAMAMNMVNSELMANKNPSLFQISQ